MYRTGYRRFSLKIEGVEEPEVRFFELPPIKLNAWKDFLANPTSTDYLIEGFNWALSGQSHEFWSHQYDRLPEGRGYTDEAWEIIQSWRRQEGYV